MYKNIQRSLRQNNNITCTIKAYSSIQIGKNTLKNSNICKRHKVCIHTGRRGGLLKGFDYSRIALKRLINYNKATNIKKNNW